MAMIFTPCQEGITHNNNERAEAGYTAPGVNVLLHAAAAHEADGEDLTPAADAVLRHAGAISLQCSLSG